MPIRILIQEVTKLFCETCQIGVMPNTTGYPLTQRIIDQFLTHHQDHRLSIEARSRLRDRE